MKFIILSLVIAFASVSLNAASRIDEVIDLYQGNEYSKALTLLDSELAAKPKDLTLNLWKGKCLYELGKTDEAFKCLDYVNQRGVGEAAYYVSKIKAADYLFDEALDALTKYEALAVKNKKTVPEKILNEKKRVEEAKTMFAHVQKIVVLDSINVDKDTFFKYYKLSQDCGKLSSDSIYRKEHSEQSVVFTTPNKERMIWAMPDSTGKMSLVEKTKLIDGTWDEATIFAKNIAGTNDVNYPFVMPDGSTMYFAAKGDSSLGGYDLYMSRKDSDTGEYLMPQNIGMPFNSPQNDYMLVIDENTGFGWWATDRNNLPGKVTIYVYQLPKIRENYPEDEPNLRNLATLDNYRLTWHDKGYESSVVRIHQIKTADKEDNTEFEFVVAPGLMYTNSEDFKSKDALLQMQTLLKTYAIQRSDIDRLNGLRTDYSTNVANRKKTSADIVKLEKQIEKRRVDIFNTENYIRKIEAKTNTKN